MNQNLTTLGLSINFIGSVILAFSLTAGEKIGEQIENDKTRDFYLPNFHKWIFRGGTMLLILGFLIQLASVVCTF